MRIVFFGTPDFAVPTLRMVVNSHYDVVGVITQPDKARGRGRRVTPTPVKELAMVHDLPVHQPASVRSPEFLELFREMRPDVAVVVAYGKILPKAVLEVPLHGCLNVHASLLPAYRGAAPIQWAIVNGEKTTGVSIMQLDEGMDTGPVAAIKEVPILEDDDALSVGNLLSLEGALLMEEVLEELEKSGVLKLAAQDDSKATHAPLIEREMARIHWGLEAERIIWAVRGFLPWPKAFTTIKGEELKITGMEAADPDWAPATAGREEVPAGTVVEIIKGRGFLAKTGSGNQVVLVTRVQSPGKGEVGAFDFFNGGGIAIGDRLGS